MSAANRITVVLPSLNPDEKLRLVVEGLTRVGFDDIIIVNDGSDEAHLPNFPSPEEFPNIEILTHEVNRGKGAALKTAFAHFLRTREGRVGVITVDGDNQHHPEDVLACAEVLCAIPRNVILGVRDFSGPDVPARSRSGNRITSFVFRAFCGMKISDTQTGLRAIPAEHLPQMLEVEGDRFEYLYGSTPGGSLCFAAGAGTDPCPFQSGTETGGILPGMAGAPGCRRCLYR